MTEPILQHIATDVNYVQDVLQLIQNVITVVLEKFTVGYFRVKFVHSKIFSSLNWNLQ